MNILKASRWTAASLLAVGSLYACAPHAVQPTPTGALCRTEAYFSRRGGAAPALINVLDQAQTSIHAAMYGLTKAQIVDALLAAKRRGVDVALKTDKIENAGKAQAAVIAKLQAAGVPVEISEQARLPYCYGPRPVFAAEAPIPSSSQTPVRATDKDGTPV